MAEKKKERTHFITLVPRDEVEDKRLYQVDGRNYIVAVGVETEVPEFLYQAIRISGDLDYRTRA